MTLLLALAATLFLAIRLPGLPASLEDLDSINFALAIRDYDVAAHQPHPPGYPVYIGLAKLVHAAVGSEHLTLALLGTVAGALGILVLPALFARLSGDVEQATAWALAATALTVLSPLYWWNASRPMSDTLGLVTAAAVQAVTLAARSERAVAGAACLAAVATGLRTQVSWLTFPLVALQVVRRPAGTRMRGAVKALAAGGLGALVWAVPLVLTTGGPAGYARVLRSQGKLDLGDTLILWDHPSVAKLALALDGGLLKPWVTPWLGVPLLGLALVGVARMARDPRPSGRRALLSLGCAFVPYLALDVLFQQAVTARYALPLVPPVAYLAVRGLAGARRAAPAAVLALLVAPVAVLGPLLAWAPRIEAPAFRMLREMRERQASSRDPTRAPVLVLHRRLELDLSRPLKWIGSDRPLWADRLTAREGEEWLEVVRYFRRGGQETVWFVADPLRSDLALIDPRSRELIGAYRWPVTPGARLLAPDAAQVLMGGTRPGEMDLHAIAAPGWLLGTGFQLTPETTGLAESGGRDPARDPVEGYVRRRPEAVTLVIGGRNLAGSGTTAEVRVLVDGRLVDTTVAHDTFVRLIHLPAGALAGPAAYATVVIAATIHPAAAPERGETAEAPVRVAIDQFDAQSGDRVVFGLGSGWHRPEYDPTTGRSWRWMSGRSTLRVHTAGRPVVVHLSGDPAPRGARGPGRLVVSGGPQGRVLLDTAIPGPFLLDVPVPAELAAAGGPAPDAPGARDADSGALEAGDLELTLETDTTFVPSEHDTSHPDTRRLGIRVAECRVVAAP